MANGLLIVDYSMGNIGSVASALRYLGHEPVISDSPSAIAAADALILPGVGSFKKARQRLDDLQLTEALREAVQGRKRKILGICLGMQLMAEKGTEDGESEGLGFFTGQVERFTPTELGEEKIPHIGFNRVASDTRMSLFEGLPSAADFYFVHSFRLLAGIRPGKSATCQYGIEFLAAHEHENVFATQFHPEKSQTNGLQLLQNFLRA